MGKTEKGTPKDLANKMKAKGLQKLRWYCQMCQKQCRDENGFKCHTMSESHQRQLLLFAENPDKYLDSFSEEFMEGYTSLLKRRFGTKRVHANNVYQEYIQDRHHVHMNATQWETLTDFVKWLGREGYCVVDETEKGWYVAYVDRDPETIRRQEMLKKKEKFEKDEEERMQEFINRQIELGQQKEKKEEAVYTELKHDEEGKAVGLNLKLSTNKVPVKLKTSAVNNVLEATSSKKRTHMQGKTDSKKQRTALEEIMEAEMQEKRAKEMLAKQLSAEKDVRKERPWLQRDIIVKIVSKDLGSKYYKVKGVVNDIVNEYVGVIILLECGTTLKVDQAKLETVIPSPERKVLILNGKYSGMEAILKKINESTFSAELELKNGKVLSSVPYEDFSKLHVP